MWILHLREGGEDLQIYEDYLKEIYTIDEFDVYLKFKQKYLEGAIPDGKV